MQGNLNPQVTGNGDLATSTDYSNLILQQLSLMLRTKKLFWNKKQRFCAQRKFCSRKSI